jgi:hypothetical protein
MADEKPQPFHEEILLLAEKLGEITDRLATIEKEHATQTAPLNAAAGAQDSALKALEAALLGVKALNFHVLDNNLGAVSSRLTEVEKQADAAIKALDADLAKVTKALALVSSDVFKRIELEKGERTELETRRDADAKEFAAAVEGVRGDLANLQTHLAERIEAAKKEFATPATLNPSGKYVPNRIYSRLDLVEINGSSFVSTEDNNSEQPGRGSKKWQTIARRGAAAGGGGMTPEPASEQALTDAATITWDLINPTAKVTLGGNRALEFRNVREGGTYILHVIQDGGGSRTLTWPASVVWPGGLVPTLTTTANYRDVFTFTVSGAHVFGAYVQNYAV